MAEEQYDEWGLADAPLLGAGTVTIHNASFGYNAAYKNGEQELAIFEGTVVDEGGEEHAWNQVYSVGSGWAVVDGGSRIERSNGKKAGVQKQSKYGLFIAAALESGAGDVLRKRGSSTEAKVWNGLMFEVEGREVDYGGEIGKRPVLVPVRFLGETGTATPAASTPKAAAPSANGNGGLSPALKAKLKKLAAECDTHDAFIDRAFVEIDGVDGNKEAEAAVADSSELYESLRA